MSGTGPKAGGTSYLEQFHFPLVHESQSPSSSVSWIASTGYRLITPYPSLISVHGRLQRFDKVSSHILHSFESITGKVNENEKIKLEKFINWTKVNLRPYLTGKHLNHVIPGQLSYNDKNMIKEAGLFVMTSDTASPKALEYFLGAVALGTGLSIVCVTQESYSLWKGIVDKTHQAGFARANIDVGLLSPTELEELLHESEYSFVYADKYLQYKDEIYSSILNANSLSKSMRQILSDYDGVFTDSPAVIFDQFVWVRSMAINTMRHGAPLELNS